MKMLYKCEICGRISEHKSEIEKCERKGRQNPLVREGDIVYFKDGPETPIIYDFDNRLGRALFNNYKEKEYKPKTNGKYPINKIYKYMVAKVDIQGHCISYTLQGIEGESIDFCYQEFDRINTFFHYPTIVGNDMMELVLKLYNK